jgi:hypothetical protein
MLAATAEVRNVTVRVEWTPVSAFTEKLHLNLVSMDEKFSKGVEGPSPLEVSAAPLRLPSSLRIEVRPAAVNPVAQEILAKVWLQHTSATVNVWRVPCP